MKYILDDEDRIRVVGMFVEGYCNHGVPLDEMCKECESDAEIMDMDETGLAYDRCKELE